MEGGYNRLEGGQTGWRVDRRDGGWTDGMEGAYNRLGRGQTGWKVNITWWRVDRQGGR